MTYADKLKHPFWQRKRLEILERDHFTCKLCGDRETTLHVHHKKYIKGNDAWDYDNSLLETLCEDCHKAITMLHKDYGKNYIFIDAYKDFIYLFIVGKLKDSEKKLFFSFLFDGTGFNTYTVLLEDEIFILNNLLNSANQKWQKD